MRELENLVNNIELIRKYRGISRCAFAKELDIPITTLHDLINKKNTSVYTLIQISEKLGVSIDVLFSENMHTDEMVSVSRIMENISFLSQYDSEQHKQITYHANKILEVMRNNVEQKNDDT